MHVKPKPSIFYTKQKMRMMIQNTLEVLAEPD